MSLTVQDLQIGFDLYLTAKPNTSDGAVAVPLDIQGRRFAKYVANFGTGLVVGVQNISMAYNTTGGDINLASFADIISSTNIALTKLVAGVLVNTTPDPTALLSLAGGATNPLTSPWSSWRIQSFGLNSRGESLPGTMLNPNTNSSYQWAVASGGQRTVAVSSNTPATETTLTGRLIVIGYP